MNTWYAKVRKEIESQYGDNADLFCDLLAAASPRKQVQANWNLAARVYDWWMDRRILEDPPEWTVHDRNYMRRMGVMTPHIGNVMRALDRKELSGPKVRAFAANLKGDHSQVTVDVWMLKLFDHDKPSAKARKEVCKFVVRAAEEMGCSPAEMQAEMWEFSIRRAGREPKSFVAAAVKQRQMKLFKEV